MNKGFRVEIQKELIPEEDEEAREMADKFPSDYKCRLESSAYFRRGKLGLKSNKFPYLYIRRACKNRRVFHVVKEDVLELVQCKQNDKILMENESKYNYMTPLTDIKMCMCAIHKGGLKVRLKQPIETYIYREEGIIKG